MSNYGSNLENIPLEILDELLVRFVINLPESEYSLDRFFFNIQKAFWFYKDFYLSDNHAGKLNLQRFARTLYLKAPNIRHMCTFESYSSHFYKYITEIPVYGAIMLNKKLDKVLLVTNFTNKHYGFPRGKINEGEDGVSCAIREVWEEIGIDITNYINSESCINFSTKKESKTMYVVIGVPENTKFNPNHITRKEIGKIEWVTIDEFNRQKETDKFNGIKAFLPPVKLYIEKYKEKMGMTTGFQNIMSINNEANSELQKYSKVNFMRRVEEKIISFGRRLEERIGQIDYKCKKPQIQEEDDNQDKILIENGASLSARLSKKQEKKANKKLELQLSKQQNPFLESFDLKNLLEEDQVDNNNLVNQKTNFLDFTKTSKMSPERDCFNSDNDILYDNMRQDRKNNEWLKLVDHKDSIEILRRVNSIDTENQQVFNFPTKAQKLKKLNSDERVLKKHFNVLRGTENAVNNFSDKKATKNCTFKENRKESYYSINEVVHKKDSTDFKADTPYERDEDLIDIFDKNRNLDKARQALAKQKRKKSFKENNRKTLKERCKEKKEKVKINNNNDLGIKIKNQKNETSGKDLEAKLKKKNFEARKKMAFSENL